MVRDGSGRPETSLNGQNRALVVVANSFGRTRAPLPKPASGTLIASAVVIIDWGDVLCRPIEVAIHR